MTVHTRAATDEIYSIFNQPLKAPCANIEEESGAEDSDDDDDCTSCGESTGTGRFEGMSEAGDVEDEIGDVKSVSEWSDFTTRKHIPKFDEDQTQDTQASHADSITNDIERQHH